MKVMFDSVKSISEARYGKLIAAEHRKELLSFFRAMAVEYARKDPFNECDSSSLAKYAWAQYELDISKILQNACGSIFNGREWKFTGRWTRSERVRSHGRDVKIWKLCSQ